MGNDHISRRQFLQKLTALAGALTVSPFAQSCAPSSQTPAEVATVPIGKQPYPISRLGIGTGTDNGEVPRALGQEKFTQLIRYAYERGITFIDTADVYRTHNMVRRAVKKLPRENLWIQTKMDWQGPLRPFKPLEVIDRFRYELDTDYIDSLLIHCINQAPWPDAIRRFMNAFDEAQSRGWIRMKGVSCHGLPALKQSTDMPWVEIQPVRINPYGRYVDGPQGIESEPGAIDEVLQEVKRMHEKGRGIIGMKLIGKGEFQNPIDRERSFQFAWHCGFVDAVLVGFTTPQEIDEAISFTNRALKKKS